MNCPWYSTVCIWNYRSSAHRYSSASSRHSIVYLVYSICSLSTSMYMTVSFLYAVPKWLSAFWMVSSIQPWKSAGVLVVPNCMTVGSMWPYQVGTASLDMLFSLLYRRQDTLWTLSFIYIFAFQMKLYFCFIYSRGYHFYNTLLFISMNSMKNQIPFSCIFCNRPGTTHGNTYWDMNPMAILM